MFSRDQYIVFIFLPLILKFSEATQIYPIQLDRTALIFEVWNKNVFSFTAKMFFSAIQADEGF